MVEDFLICWCGKYNNEKIRNLGDWKIIFPTVKTVLTKEGINSETAATMETFHGS